MAEVSGQMQTGGMSESWMGASLFFDAIAWVADAEFCGRCLAFSTSLVEKS